MGLVHTHKATEPTLLALPLLHEQLTQPIAAAIRDHMVAANPVLANYSVDFDPEAITSVVRISAIAQAALVVIVHAAVDAALNEHLRLLAQHRPEFWEKQVKDETVTLRDFASTYYKAALTKKVISHVESTCVVKSVPKKIQLVLTICGYHESCLISGFRFQPNAIRRFDTLRHEIAHGEKAGVIIEDLGKAIWFVWQTIGSIHNTVGRSLGLPRRDLNDVEPEMYATGHRPPPLTTMKIMED